MLASASEVPTTALEPDLITTDAPAPWGHGPELFVPPHALKGISAYHRYQRMAHIGTPIFVGGVAMGVYGVWAIQTQQNGALNAPFVITAGGAAAWAGAGMMSFGSVTAVQRLYGDDLRMGQVVPGYISYGFLGISAASAGIAYYLLFVAPVLAASFVAIAIPIGIAGGVPAIIQVAMNPIYRRRWDKTQATQLSVVPMLENQRRGMRLAMRF